MGFFLFVLTLKIDQTCSAVLNAGVDLDCGYFLPLYLEQAVTDGAVSMDLVDSHLVNLFQVQVCYYFVFVLYFYSCFRFFVFNSNMVLDAVRNV
jgi:hypothetical protein